MSTRIPAGVDDCLASLHFITMIPIDCKITNFFLYLFVNFFGNNYNIGELTSAKNNHKYYFCVCPIH